MKGLRFYGLLDFYPRKEEIKEQFEELTIDERILFKKEVYSLCFEKEHVKDLIWEYLNDYDENGIDLAREFRLKRDKVQKNIVKP